jgi:hypothetical protein
MMLVPLTWCGGEAGGHDDLEVDRRCGLKLWWGLE